MTWRCDLCGKPFDGCPGHSWGGRAVQAPTQSREHVTDGPGCWCCPTIEPGVVIHHEPH